MNNQDLIQALPNLDQPRLRTYQDLLKFYNGDQWEYQTRRERRLTFNYTKVAIDKITSYVMSSMNFAVYPEQEGDAAFAKAREAEKVLYQVYEDNNLAALDFDTEIDTAILGDGCYKVTWDDQEKRVRITAPDPQGIFAWWLGDDMSRVWRVATKYSLTADETEMLFKFTPKQKKAIIVEIWTKDKFSLFIDELPFRDEVNPYGFIPFVIFPNLREPKKFWGVSDIPTITEPQRELNRALSQLSRILELSGNPIAVLENVESSEDIAVAPGAVWNLPEDSKAYLLDLLKGGGVKLHVEYINLLYRTLHDITESPRAAFGGIERDLSGVALEIELHPLLQKVSRKRVLRTTAYQERSRMILSLLKKYKGMDFGEISHQVIWGPVLPQDKSRQGTFEQVMVQTGIHAMRTAMGEVGIRDPEAEFCRWMAERASILKQNAELKGNFTRGGSRTRATEDADNV